MHKFFTVILAVVAVTGPFMAPGNASATDCCYGNPPSPCADARLIYSQDVAGIPPDDGAFVNTRDGYRVFTIPQVQDHYIVFPQTVTIPLFPGDTLNYQQWYAGSAPYLPFDLLNANGSFVDAFVFNQNTTFDPASYGVSSGYIRFNAGDVAWEQNFLVLCPAASPPQPPPPQNLPPVWSSIGSQTALIGQVLQFSVFASDPEGHSITYSATQLPSGAQFNPVARIFTWTPISGQAGTHVATFQATDGVHSVPLSVSIFVNAPPSVNQPPTWSSIGSPSVSVNQTLQFSVFAADPEGQSLTYSAPSLPSGASFNAFTRVFTWTPSSSQAGTYTVTFSVSDGTHTVPMSASITVLQVIQSNQPPQWAQIPTQFATIGQTLQFSVFASDPENQFLTYSAFSLPSGASFNPSTRVFAWTPFSGQGGTYTVTFRVSDGTHTVDMNVSISVSGSQFGGPFFGNQPPQWFQIPAQTVVVGQTLQFSVSASDPNGNFLTYSAFQLPPGSTFNTLTNVFTWAPQSNQLGTSNVIFRVSDGQTSTDMYVAITVVPGFQFPTGSPLAFVNFNPPLFTIEGDLYSYSVRAVSGTRAITYRVINGPAGFFINSPTGLITWVPGSNQGRSAPYAITIGASDGVQEITRSYQLHVQNRGAVLSSSTAVPSTPLVINNLTVSVESNNDIVVRWETNKPARSRVIYGIFSQADRQANDYRYENATIESLDVSLTHRVVLNSLEPGQTYYLRAVSKANGEMRISEERVVELKDDGSGLASVPAALGDLLKSGWFFVMLLLIIGIGWLIGRMYGRRRLEISALER